ncbi:MAG: RibD family protein [Pseudomonadota bacterium]
MKSGLSKPCCSEWLPEERDALDLYGPLMAPTERPLVFAQIGQSLDGRVATLSGDAQDVSGTDGLKHLHRLRAIADAVVIGVKTALCDCPQLTVRLAGGDNPARVVIDPDGRLPNDAKLLQDDGVRRIVIQACDKVRPNGVETIKLARRRWIAPHAIIGVLDRMGFRKILIEGGGITIAQFLEAGLLDRLHFAVAPLVIGSGPQGLSTSPIASLSQALRPQTKVYNLGSDIVFDCRLERKAVPETQTALDSPERSKVVAFSGSA